MAKQKQQKNNAKNKTQNCGEKNKKQNKTVDCWKESKFDPNGSYTGRAMDIEYPTQDADDL